MCLEPRPPSADVVFAELEKLKPAHDPRAGWGQIKAEAGSLSTASFLQRAAQRTREAALESPPAGSGVSATGAVSSDPEPRQHLLALLEQTQLLQFAEPLKGFGCQDIDDLGAMREDELAQVGMRPLQARRVLQLARESTRQRFAREAARLGTGADLLPRGGDPASHFLGAGWDTDSHRAAEMVDDSVDRALQRLGLRMPPRLPSHGHLAQAEPRQHAEPEQGRMTAETLRERLLRAQESADTSRRALHKANAVLDARMAAAERFAAMEDFDQARTELTICKEVREKGGGDETAVAAIDARLAMVATAEAAADAATAGLWAHA